MLYYGASIVLVWIAVLWMYMHRLIYKDRTCVVNASSVGMTAPFGTTSAEDTCDDTDFLTYTPNVRFSATLAHSYAPPDCVEVYGSYPMGGIMSREVNVAAHQQAGASACTLSEPLMYTYLTKFTDRKRVAYVPAYELRRAHGSFLECIHFFVAKNNATEHDFVVYFDTNFGIFDSECAYGCPIDRQADLIRLHDIHTLHGLPARVDSRHAKYALTFEHARSKSYVEETVFYNHAMKLPQETTELNDDGGHVKTPPTTQARAAMLLEDTAAQTAGNAVFFLYAGPVSATQPIYPEKIPIEGFCQYFFSKIKRLSKQKIKPSDQPRVRQRAHSKKRV